MPYIVKNNFIKIAETSGTIQNTSQIYDVEISHKAEPDSGILLRPLNKYTFSDQTIYLRCIDTTARAVVRVVPFIVDGAGIISSGGTPTGSDTFTPGDVDDIFNP